MNNFMRVLAVDDSDTSNKTLDIFLRKLLPLAELKFSTHIYSIFTKIEKYHPDALVLDFEYEGSDLSKEERALSELDKFNGLIIVYSSHPEKYVKKALKGKLSNYEFIHKTNPSGLAKRLRDYELSLREES